MFLNGPNFLSLCCGFFWNIFPDDRAQHAPHKDDGFPAQVEDPFETFLNTAQVITAAKWAAIKQAIDSAHRLLLEGRPLQSHTSSGRSPLHFTSEKCENQIPDHKRMSRFILAAVLFSLKCKWYDE